MKLTYQEAYSKIVEAYFKDEIQPMKSEFCFCGTLTPSPSYEWNLGYMHLEREFPYSWEEYKDMEKALLKEVTSGKGWQLFNANTKFSEDSLFRGMSDALDILRKIHIKRGENVDEWVPEKKFEKRNLQGV